MASTYHLIGDYATIITICRVQLTAIIMAQVYENMWVRSRRPSQRAYDP
jgi:hypothetical protein